MVCTGGGCAGRASKRKRHRPVETSAISDHFAEHLGKTRRKFFSNTLSQYGANPRLESVDRAHNFFAVVEAAQQTMDEEYYGPFRAAMAASFKNPADSRNWAKVVNSCTASINTQTHKNFGDFKGSLNFEVFGTGGPAPAHAKYLLSAESLQGSQRNLLEILQAIEPDFPYLVHAPLLSRYLHVFACNYCRLHVFVCMCM